MTEATDRRHVKGAPIRVCMGMVLVLLSSALSACSGAALPSGSLHVVPQGRIVVPPCWSVPENPTPLPNEQQGFGGAVVMTSRVEPALGFRPLVATTLPAAVTWNAFAVIGPGPIAVPLPPGVVAPLFQASYRLMAPQGTRASASFPAVLTLDETTAAWSPPTGLYYESAQFHLLSQMTTHVGAAPATLYYLSPPSATQESARATVITVVWQVGAVALQLTAIKGGTAQLQFTQEASVHLAPGAPASGPPANPALGTLISWAGASDAVMLAVAGSVSAYTGCQTGG
jgi:hypothetical protein